MRERAQVRTHLRRHRRMHAQSKRSPSKGKSLLSSATKQRRAPRDRTQHLRTPLRAQSRLVDDYIPLADAPNSCKVVALHCLVAHV